MVTPTAARFMQATRARFFRPGGQQQIGYVRNKQMLLLAAAWRGCFMIHADSRIASSTERTAFRSISACSRTTMARDNGGRLVQIRFKRPQAHGTARLLRIAQHALYTQTATDAVPRNSPQRFWATRRVEWQTAHVHKGGPLRFISVRPAVNAVVERKY